MNDNSYLTTMAELKFISQVGDDEFLNTRTGTIESKNFITNAIRAIRFPAENGKCTAQYCRNVVLKGLDLYDKYVEAEESEYVKTIRNYIMDARGGIERLKKTHSTNTMAYTLFEAIQVCIDQRVRE